MQQYRLVIRTVGNASAKDGSVMDADGAMAQLNEYYLEQGFTIQSVNYLGAFPPTPEGGVGGHMFAYHLLKDVEKVKAGKEKSAE